VKLGAARLAGVMALGLVAGALAAPDPPSPMAPIPAAATQAAPANYAVTGAVKLGGEGPWGHVAQDAEGKRLYVLSTDWMRVIDSATGKTLAEMGVGNGARGIVLVPEVGRGFVSNGWGQTVTVFDLKTNTGLGLLKFDHETEAIIYDPVSKHLFVSQGSGHVVVPFAADIDVKTAKTETPIDLDGYPLAMVADGQGMVYVTLPDKEQVAVIDTRAMKLIATWQLLPGERPTGIAMDRLHSRLFVGMGSGVVVLSATDGHDLARLPINGGVDAMAFFDGKAFASSSNGTFTVIGQNAAGAFVVEQTLRTGFAGANMNGSTPNESMIMNPKTGAIYLPAGEAQRNGGAPLFKLLILEKK
jgi:DNA-binding beta-propeller fold protein YncE